MMTDERAPQEVDAEADADPVPWARLARNPAHRTSQPTNERVRAAWRAIGAARREDPRPDTVIFAALRIAGIDVDADGGLAMAPEAFTRLREEVERIEAETFPVRQRGGRP
jgi:hypothetical protein